MEQKTPKFRLHLNLFDGIVLILAICAAALLVWNRIKPASSGSDAPAASSFQYTICLRNAMDGLHEHVKPGDHLVDAVKNFELGQVKSVRFMPATQSIVDEESQTYVTAEIPGSEDVLIEVETTASIGDERVTVGSGYELRVGEKIFVRGPGYLGAGEVYAMERGE